MSGTLVFIRPISRSMHRAALVTLGVVFAVSIDGGVLHAQGAPQGGQTGAPMHRGVEPHMGMGMEGRPGMMMRMMSDPAARLLDEQSLLELSSAQVSELIALHETTRRQMKAVTDQLRAMMPRMQGQNQGQPQGQRMQMSQVQRDNLAALMDSLRTIRWRATSAADSVLTTEQRHRAIGFALDRRNQMHHGWSGGRGMGAPDGMRRMEGPGMRGGPGGMRTPRTPNDSGPSGE